MAPFFCVSQSPSPVRKDKALYMYECNMCSSFLTDMKIIQLDYFLSSSEGKMDDKNIKLMEDHENFNIVESCSGFIVWVRCQETSSFLCCLLQLVYIV